METEWQRHNRAAVAERMRRVCAMPDGVLETARAGRLLIEIHKRSGQVSLFFRDPDSGELDGPMSRIACEQPFMLLGEYTQAVLLALLWLPEPQRACMLGFGGGRLSLVLHQVLPELMIDNVDIDPVFGIVAERYFGVQFDQRQHLIVDDARHFLERATSATYAMIVMDAFSDQHDELDHLATAECYAAAIGRLQQRGVMCINFLRSDAHFAEKTYTFVRSFVHVCVAAMKHSVVVFGSRSRLDMRGLEARAGEIARRYELEIPLADHAHALRRYRDSELAALHHSVRPRMLKDNP